MERVTDVLGLIILGIFTVICQFVDSSAILTVHIIWFVQNLF